MKILFEAGERCSLKTNYMQLEGNKVSFTIQDGPVKSCGINGIQVTDVLEYITEVFRLLDFGFPCRENSLTITKLEEAIPWQHARTRDREKRNVEGKNLA